MRRNHVLFLEDSEPVPETRAHIVLAPPEVEPLHEVFAEAMLEDTSAHQRRSALDWVVSIGVHFAVLAALLILPLYFTTGLDFQKLNLTFLAAPAMPSAPPPPPLTSSAVPKPARMTPARVFTPGRLISPTFIPKAVVTAPDSAGAPPDEALMEVPDGVVRRRSRRPGRRRARGRVGRRIERRAAAVRTDCGRAESARPRGWRGEAAAPAVWARSGVSDSGQAGPPFGGRGDRSGH